MDERKHINILYQYSDNWIGGTYYILNIIKALKFLDDKDKPFLTIYYDHSTSLSDLNKIDYPYIEYIGLSFKSSLTTRIINRAFLLLTGKPVIKIKLPSKSIVNFYSRTLLDSLDSANMKNYYYWIPDLQDLYLPQFFSKFQLKARAVVYKRLINDNEKIVFSSGSALMDFNRFYPKNNNIKKVVKFVSIQDINLDSLSITDLKNKFDIKQDYFIVSNQFWKHKNHKIVLEAFSELFKKHSTFQLIFTGKEYDDRNGSAHIDELKNYVAKNNLANKVLFLGFIDRNEQFKLMKESLAIIQPSLFEGWSTVVEDAKFLNKCIICSDIPVHREQLPDSELFFDPLDKNSLVNIVEKFINKEVPCEVLYDHKSAITKFAHEFIDIF